MPTTIIIGDGAGMNGMSGSTKSTNGEENTGANTGGGNTTPIPIVTTTINKLLAVRSCELVLQLLR